MSDAQRRATEAVDAGRWTDALAVLDEADGSRADPELLELRARAAYGAGDLEGSIAAWEDLHRELATSGEVAGAARAAAMVAMFLMIDTGLMSPVRGWIRRAEALLADEEEGPVDAVVAAVQTYERFMCGDLEGARQQAGLAIELGRRHGALAPEVIGRTAQARVEILEGRVAEGIDQLEEVGAVLMSGQVDALTTGMMLCEVVCAAQGLARHDLAAEWTEAMDRWGRGAAFGGLAGRCRVHKAEMLRVSGPCDAAEAEALGACDDLRPWMRREFGWPLAELGNVRLRKGDLDGAAEAFLAADEHVWCPHPGLALVRLAQGRIAEAAQLIDDAVAHPVLIPSKERPPSSDLTLAPLLEARVEISIAAGDPATALAATGELETIAERFESPWLDASAALARARSALATGDLHTATSAGREALDRWAAMGAPYETARARLVVADALEAAGTAGAARTEREAAARAFEAYGADRAASDARARLEDAHRAGGPEPDPGRPLADATFRVQGDARLVRFAGTEAVLHDLKGYRYLARLLADPGREFHVLDLVAVEQGTLPTTGAAAVGPVDPEWLEAAHLTGGGLPALDDQARESYRRRLADVEEDLADALAAHDPARAELAERDRDYLVAELARAVGLGGRTRSVGSDAERARTAVTRTIRYAIGKLGEHVPDLAAHLDRAVRTGTYCSYVPDPRSAVAWTV